MAKMEKMPLKLICWIDYGTIIFSISNISEPMATGSAQCPTWARGFVEKHDKCGNGGCKFQASEDEPRWNTNRCEFWQKMRKKIEDEHIVYCKLLQDLYLRVIALCPRDMPTEGILNELPQIIGFMHILSQHAKHYSGGSAAEMERVGMSALSKHLTAMMDMCNLLYEYKIAAAIEIAQAMADAFPPIHTGDKDFHYWWMTIIAILLRITPV
jgi:hypothetical protein